MYIFPFCLCISNILDSDDTCSECSGTVAERIQEFAELWTAQEGVVGMPIIRAVPRSNDILWSSFICTPYSLENNNRAYNGTSIQDDDGEGAITFNGTVDFAANGSTKLGVSENASSLLKKFGSDAESDAVTDDDEPADESEDINAEASRHHEELEADFERGNSTLSLPASGTSERALAPWTDIPADLNQNVVSIYAKFHSKGMVVLHVILDNQHFMIPQSRSRAWFIFANFANLKISPDDALVRLTNAKDKILEMRDSLRGKTLPMQACTLMPANHPILIDEMDKRGEKIDKKKATNKATKAKPTWYDDMKAVYAENGIPFVEPAPGSGVLHHVGTQKLDPFAERSNVWYAALATREKYVLDLIQKIYPRVGSEKRAFVLSRSARRSTKSRPKANIDPCTMPRSKVWLEWLDRDQVGTEKLMTQGLFPVQYSDARCSQTALADLAGNAVGCTVAQVINQCLLEEFIDVLPLRETMAPSRAAASAAPV